MGKKSLLFLYYYRGVELEYQQLIRASASKKTAAKFGPLLCLELTIMYCSETCPCNKRPPVFKDRMVMSQQ